MKLEQSFEVSAPIDRVWAALIDVERVAPCLPGAQITGRNDDGSFDGTFRVKIGPTAAAYSGKLNMDQIDEGGRSATMNAQGTDRRGQGGAKATIVSSVAAIDQDTTRVEVVTDYHITGRLARFGRGGMIEEISNRLLDEFAKSLQAMLAGDGGAQPEPAPAEAAPAESAPAEAAPISEAAASAELAAIVTEADRAATPDVAPAPDAAAAPDVPAVAQDGPAAPPPLAAAPPPPPPPPPASAPESEPVQGLTLVGSALWKQAKRNPAPVAALVLGFLLALRVFRRRG